MAQRRELYKGVQNGHRDQHHLLSTNLRRKLRREEKESGIAPEMSKVMMNIIFNEDTNFTSSGLQRGPRTSKHILKIIKLQMKITRQNKQVITIQFFRGGS